MVVIAASSSLAHPVVGATPTNRCLAARRVAVAAGEAVEVARAWRNATASEASRVRQTFEREAEGIYQAQART
jgi:hypothetical protein